MIRKVESRLLCSVGSRHNVIQSRARNHLHYTCSRMCKHRNTDDTEEASSFQFDDSYLFTKKSRDRSGNCQNEFHNLELQTTAKHDSQAIRPWFEHKVERWSRFLQRININNISFEEVSSSLCHSLRKNWAAHSIADGTRIIFKVP